ncbi:MAG: hypothetical protein ACTSRI_03470 [Promethearchaeota archaeon]
MIKSVYIMKENGFLLYSKNLIKDQFNHDVILGFFASVANFSREALNSVVNYIDLGEYKLIILPLIKEKLLVAAIANPEDNNDLINKILRNIMQDFIDEYSPEYNPKLISEQKVDKIVGNNLKGKIIKLSSKKFILIAWLIVAPLSYLLILLSALFTSEIFHLFDLDKIMISRTDLFTIFIPTMVLLALFNYIILFILPNLIFGFLIVKKKIGTLNSLIHITIVITLYFFTVEPLFAYIIIAYLPMNVIAAPIICRFGYIYQRKLFLIK